MISVTCIIGAYHKKGVVIAASRRVALGDRPIEASSIFLMLGGKIAIAFAGELVSVINLSLSRLLLPTVRPLIKR